MVGQLEVVLTDDEIEVLLWLLELMLRPILEVDEVVGIERLIIVLVLDEIEVRV